MDEDSHKPNNRNGVTNDECAPSQNGTAIEVPNTVVNGIGAEPVPNGSSVMEMKGIAGQEVSSGKHSTEAHPLEVTVPIDEYSHGDFLENDFEKTSLHRDPRSLDSHPAASSNPISRCRGATSAFLRRYRRVLRLLFQILLILGFHGYLGAAIYINRTSELHPSFGFCNGVGLLVIITAMAYWSFLYYRVIKPNIGKCSRTLLVGKSSGAIRNIANNSITKRVICLLLLSGLLTFAILDTIGDRYRLVSLAGLLVFLFASWLFSKHPDRVIWRHVFWGLAIQFTFGLVVLKWEVGRSIFTCIGDKVKIFLGYTDEGSEFVFGFLVSGKNFVLATRVLPVIIFFSFCIQILYYYGVMCWILTRLGWILQITVGTTACESLNAAANIFIGQTEAPLLVRPFLHLLTVSELHAVMTGGFATIAGSVMAAYIHFGVSASHLLSASVMAAPVALAVSKLIYPETQQSQTKAGQINIKMDDKVNVLDAAAQGAMSVVKICGYIAASLIAFIAFISLVNGILGWLGNLVGLQISFEIIASWVLRPLALIMGVPWKDCGVVSELLALKIVINEFVAYKAMVDMIKRGLLSQRSVNITTFALCGFANLSSIGIQISGLSAMAPEKKADLARIAFSAMLAGNVASFLNACVAGFLIEGGNEVAILHIANDTTTTLAGLTNLTTIS